MKIIILYMVLSEVMWIPQISYLSSNFMPEIDFDDSNGKR